MADHENVTGADQFQPVVNRRAGYTDPLGMAMRVAQKGGTLAAGEGALILEHFEPLARAALAFADAKEAAKAEWIEHGVISRSHGVSLDKATDNLLTAAEAFRATHPSDG